MQPFYHVVEVAPKLRQFILPLRNVEPRGQISLRYSISKRTVSTDHRIQVVLSDLGVVGGVQFFIDALLLGNALVQRLRHAVETCRQGADLVLAHQVHKARKIACCHALRGSGKLAQWLRNRARQQEQQ